MVGIQLNSFWFSIFVLVYPPPPQIKGNNRSSMRLEYLGDLYQLLKFPDFREGCLPSLRITIVCGVEREVIEVITSNPTC